MLPGVPTRALASLTIAFLVILPGCLEEVIPSEESINWDDGYYLIDPSSHEDTRNFTVADPLQNQTWGNATWTVFGNEHGGNCC